MLPDKEGIFWVKVGVRSAEEQYGFDGYEWHIIYREPSADGFYPDPDDEPYTGHFIILTTDCMFCAVDIIEIGPEIICPEPELAPHPHGIF